MDGLRTAFDDSRIGIHYVCAEIAVVHQYTTREYLHDCSTELNAGSAELHSIGSGYGSITELGCRSLRLVVRRSCRFRLLSVGGPPRRRILVHSGPAPFVCWLSLLVDLTLGRMSCISQRLCYFACRSDFGTTTPPVVAIAAARASLVPCVNCCTCCGGFIVLFSDLGVCVPRMRFVWRASIVIG